MFQGNSLQSGGVTIRPSSLPPKLYDVYINRDFCLSCASFIIVKGHFGKCDCNKIKVYDGSKKGYACFSWRIKTSLINYEGYEPPKSVIKQIQLQPRERLGSGSPLSSSIQVIPKITFKKKKRVKHQEAKWIISTLSYLRLWINTLNFSSYDGGACPSCHSEDSNKCGVRKNKSGNIQLYKCKKCGHTFSFNRKRPNKEHILNIISLRFQGHNYREIQKILLKQGDSIKISHTTVANLVIKYIIWIQGLSLTVGMERGVEQ